MTPQKIRAIRVIDDRLIFELDQDREVSLPISTSSRLERATPSETRHWQRGPWGSVRMLVAVGYN